MASSPDCFSQSLSCVEEVCSKAPNLFSSPKLINEESRRSRCTKHLITTPDLFCYSRSPCSRQEMNSVSLYSCSDHSHLSSSPPFSPLARPASFPISNENEADTQPIIKHREVENKFVRNSQTVSFYSTPYKKKTSRGREDNNYMSSLHFLYVNSKLGRQRTRRRWQPLSVHL